ncbi:MAG TPA: hypothetical protein DDY13_06750 [Cytophagales bacterium]|jgi:competence protein ComEA|nr:hypothetical protein [Cytophagales bacterium]
MFRFISDFISALKRRLHKLDENWFIHQKALKGHLWLMIILVILILVRIFITFIPSSTQDLSIEDSRILDSIKMVMQVNQTQTEKTKQKFSFDPNYISDDSLKLLPLNQYFTSNLVKYRDAGGFFNEISDLKKIYGYDEEEVSELLSYIHISKPKEERETSISYKPDKKNTQRKITGVGTFNKNEDSNKSQPEPFDINKATAQELIQISGIGPVFSERIIKYRQLLGGYVELNQLSEVYGLPEETVKALHQYIFIEEQFEPSKINVNKAGFKELLRHPYIDYDLAKKIDSARLYENGGLTKAKFHEILNQTDSMTLTVFPYLEF